MSNEACEPTKVAPGAFVKRFALLVLVIVCAFVPLAWAQTLPPNIVVILADDLGYGDVGFNGCPDIPTPNIDAVASNGVLCSSGYVAHPFCSPSRAALLTGRYQQRFGHENNPQFDASNPRLGLPMSELLLPQILKPAGYVCGAIGKWHLGAALNFHPLQRGFDEFFGFLDGSSEYFNAVVLRGEKEVRESAYLTDAFTREAESFITRHTTQPFFLYLAYNAPHAPYEATQSYLDRVAFIPDPDRRTLAAMMVAVDDGVGGVVQTLKDHNLLNNTLIFFLSDNGAPEQTFTRNLPLRGYKAEVYEGGIRVPFAVQWSGRLPANIIFDAPISSLDIVSTAAAAANISLPTDRVYDGLNVIPYLAGEQTIPERTLFWRVFGLGVDEGPPGSLDTTYAVRSGSFKLVQEKSTPGVPSLYDLSNDISETNDLALSLPKTVNSLQRKFAHWNSSTIPPLWQFSTDFLGKFPLSLVLAGDWDGFNIGDANAPWLLTTSTAPGLPPTPDGINWFTSTVHVAASGGDTTPGTHSFALVGGKSYLNQWGGVTIQIDDTTSIPFFSGSALGPTNRISLDDGFYYSFRYLDPKTELQDNLTLAVMKTSAPPVTVSRLAQRPRDPRPGDPVVISIATSQPKSAEERIYVRWTTDSFITSTLVEASGSGVKYSATIPAQPAGAFVQYSIITSTADFASVLTSGIIDPLILATTGPFNASVNATVSIPTLTPVPHFQTCSRR